MLQICIILACLLSRDVVLTQNLWERIQRTAISKQLQRHFKAKREKGVGTPIPRVPAPLHPCLLLSAPPASLFTLQPAQSPQRDCPNRSTTIWPKTFLLGFSLLLCRRRGNIRFGSCLLRVDLQTPTKRQLLIYCGKLSSAILKKLFGKLLCVSR